MPGGNACTPQKHEQEHSPPLPLPLARDPACVTVAAGGAARFAGGGAEAGGTAAGGSEAGGGGEAAVEFPPPPIMVPFCCIANALNAAWVLLAVGLMLNVMPDPQCIFCRQ